MKSQEIETPVESLSFSIIDSIHNNHFKDAAHDLLLLVMAFSYDISKTTLAPFFNELKNHRYRDRVNFYIELAKRIGWADGIHDDEAFSKHHIKMHVRQLKKLRSQFFDSLRKFDLKNEDWNEIVRHLQKRSEATIVLAAGIGRLKKSRDAKVLQRLIDRPIVYYALDNASEISKKNIFLVVGFQADEVKRVVSEKYEVQYVLQKKQLGTGHAVECALPLIPEHVTDLVILPGDLPLLEPKTIKKLIKLHRQGDHDITLLTGKILDPLGYGRVLYDDKGEIMEIVEEANASKAQRKQLRVIIAGIYCVRKDFLFEAIPEIKVDRKKSEFYLTDVIKIAYENNKKIGCLELQDVSEAIHINSFEDISKAEEQLKAG